MMELWTNILFTLFVILLFLSFLGIRRGDKRLERNQELLEEWFRYIKEQVEDKDGDN